MELEFWSSENKFMNKPHKHDFDAVRDELERGIWARWAPSMRTWVPKKYLGYMHGPLYQPAHWDYQKPGEPVEKRFDKLGITKASGVGDFGWYTSATEIDKVITWSKSYKPKRFIF